jgi:hypothetical protein
VRFSFAVSPNLRSDRAARPSTLSPCPCQQRPKGHDLLDPNRLNDSHPCREYETVVLTWAERGGPAVAFVVDPLRRCRRPLRDVGGKKRAYGSGRCAPPRLRGSDRHKTISRRNFLYAISLHQTRIHEPARGPKTRKTETWRPSSALSPRLKGNLTGHGLLTFSGRG